MIVELVGVVVLAIVVFGFVLEPVLRAKSDRVVLDAVALPRAAEIVDDDLDESPIDAAADEQSHERSGGGRVTLDRPVRSAGSDIS